MYKADGVGLAAPQVGILKRIFVIDVFDGEGLRVFINPEILETSGSVKDQEGCLSVPEVQGLVERPEYVKVKAINEKGERIGEDYIYANDLNAGQSQSFDIFEYVESGKIEQMKKAQFKIVEASVY